MKEVIESDINDAVIHIDAKDAFNSLNRSVALHNTAFAKNLINTYRNPARLII